MIKSKGELEKLDKLYNLYLKVTEQITKWNDTLWNDIKKVPEEGEPEVKIMEDEIEKFQKDCQKLPMDTKSYPAYKDLKQELDDMQELLPLVQNLAEDCIKDRHWEQLISLTGKDVPYTAENFTLRQLLDANLLEVKEDIEDIADSAQKQAKIEKQLRDEIEVYWETAELEIRPYQNVEVPCTISGKVQEHQEKLEDHIMQLV